MISNNKLLKKLTDDKKIYFLCLIVIGFFFFFLVGENGPILGADSTTFLEPSPGLLVSYWLYPRFLQMCKAVFGESYYLDGVFIIQSLLAIISSIILTEFLEDGTN